MDCISGPWRFFIARTGWFGVYVVFTTVFFLALVFPAPAGNSKRSIS